MPQMFPLNWLMISPLALICIMFIISIMFFQILPVTQLNPLNYKNNLMPFKW